MDSFRNRVSEWLFSFLSSHPFPTDGLETEKNVLVLSHGAYLTAMLSVIVQPPFSFAIARNVDVRQSCYNTSIMKVHLTPKKVSGGEGKKKSKIEWDGVIESWADIEHLNEKKDPVGVADDIS